MSRKITTIHPSHLDRLKLQWRDLEHVRDIDSTAKRKIQNNYNKKHSDRTFGPLKIGYQVQVKTDQEKSPEQEIQHTNKFWKYLSQATSSVCC